MFQSVERIPNCTTINGIKSVISITRRLKHNIERASGDPTDPSRIQKVHITRTPNIEGISGISSIDDKSNLILDHCLRRMPIGNWYKIESKDDNAIDSIQFAIGQDFISIKTLLLHLNYFYTCKETIKINVTKFKILCLCKTDDMSLHFGSMRTKGNPMSYYICHGSPCYGNLAKQLAEVKK